MTRLAFTSVVAGVVTGLYAWVMYLAGKPPEQIVLYVAGVVLSMACLEIGRWLERNGL